MILVRDGYYTRHEHAKLEIDENLIDDINYDLSLIEVKHSVTLRQVEYLMRLIDEGRLLWIDCYETDKTRLCHPEVFEEIKLVYPDLVSPMGHYGYLFTYIIGSINDWLWDNMEGDEDDQLDEYETHIY